MSQDASTPVELDESVVEADAATLETTGYSPGNYVGGEGSELPEQAQ